MDTANHELRVRQVLDLAAQPHRRFNPMTREWVLVSPHRTQRPWQGQVEDVAPETQLAFDPNCYLCPGNSRAGGARQTRTAMYTSRVLVRPRAGRAHPAA